MLKVLSFVLFLSCFVLFCFVLEELDVLYSHSELFPTFALSGIFSSLGFFGFFSPTKLLYRHTAAGFGVWEFNMR